MFVKHPFSMISTDASTQDVLEDRSGTGHPRTFGTYPRVLGHYVRDLGALSLEEAVRKMTSAPARRMGLGDRGEVKQGYFADLVIFDRHAVRDVASIESPSETPSGIRHVLVNGTIAMKDGDLTSMRAGRVLRR
jgi:N-acyl-D-aspartate/D-glutamate deacylase